MQGHYTTESPQEGTTLGTAVRSGLDMLDECVHVHLAHIMLLTPMGGTGPVPERRDQQL